MGRMVVGVLAGTGEGDVDTRRHGLEVGAVGLLFGVRASRWGVESIEVETVRIDICAWMLPPNKNARPSSSAVK